jgi:hypothetical protein
MSFPSVAGWGARGVLAAVLLVVADGCGCHMPECPMGTYPSRFTGTGTDTAEVDPQTGLLKVKGSHSDKCEWECKSICPPGTAPHVEMEQEREIYDDLCLNTASALAQFASDTRETKEKLNECKLKRKIPAKMECVRL